MARVCIIGNSHLGALAQSGAGMAALEQAGCDVVFWGVPGTLFPQITHAGGRLVSPAPKRSLIISSGRYDHLPLDDFDMLIFYGASVPVSGPAVRIARRLNRLAAPSSAFRGAVLEEQLALWWADKPAPALMQAVRDARPDLRCLFTTDPLVATNTVYTAAVTDPVQLRHILDAMRMHCQDWCAARDILFYRQNEYTLAEGRITTQGALSTNSVKMEKGEKHDDQDFVHMNGLYGGVVLADLLALLKSHLPALRSAG